jgi:hypothetical protein
VDVDAGVRARQATFGPGQLQAGEDLLLGTVLAELGPQWVCLGAVREFVDPGLELGQRALERVEAVALDARVSSDGEGPGGYLRWSIGT